MDEVVGDEPPPGDEAPPAPAPRPRMRVAREALQAGPLTVFLIVATAAGLWAGLL